MHQMANLRDIRTPGSHVGDVLVFQLAVYNWQQLHEIMARVYRHPRVDAVKVTEQQPA